MPEVAHRHAWHRQDTVSSPAAPTQAQRDEHDAQRARQSDGGSGTDTLALTGGGTINLNKPATFTGFEGSNERQCHNADARDNTALDVVLERDQFGHWRTAVAT